MIILIRSLLYADFSNQIPCLFQADLIHLGAKYSPCMRKDQGIQKGLDKDLEEEKNSACCVRDDGSGCVQTVESKCAVS